MTSVGRAATLEPLGVGFDSLSEEGLYRRNAGRVFGFCLSRLGRREDAEDAVQTTFLHAMRSLRRGVVPLVESAWLLGIARNVCRERWETAGRLSRLESSCDPQELERAVPAPEADTRRDDLIGLEGALARLPEQQRRAILLRDWRGLSYDEVAQQLGVSTAAVETLIFRGRRGLAQLLREEPQQTRRRLASLGNLGSLFTAIKTALTGAAAATKIAAAIVIVAGSGAVVAAGSSAGRDATQPQRAESNAAQLSEGAASSAGAALGPRIAAPPVAHGRRTAAAGAPAPLRTLPAVAQAQAGGQPVQTSPADVAAASAPAQLPPVEPAVLPVRAAAPEPQPVKKVVDTVLPVVPDPVTSLPLPDALAPPVTPVLPVGPVTPPAAGTIVETVPTLPVDPAPALPAPPVATPPVATPPVAVPPVAAPPVATPPVPPLLP